MRDILFRLTIISVFQVYGRFYYGNFQDLSHLQLNGLTSGDGNCLTLADYKPDTEVGTLWYRNKMQFDPEGGFFTSFHFRMVKDPTLPSNDSSVRSQFIKKRLLKETSGEGFAFVVQNTGPNAMGKGNSQLGYGGLTGSVAIEFDIKMDFEEQDPNNNHVSVHVPNNVTGRLSAYESTDALISSAAKARAALDNGDLYTVQITYNRQELNVFVNDFINSILRVTIPPITGDNHWVGFTSSNGNKSVTNVEICDWYFEKQPNPILVNELLVGSLNNKVYHEPCDKGFSGDHCELDSAMVIRDCDSVSNLGCVACSNQDACAWCKADRRCIPASDHGKCSDGTSVVRLSEECIYIPKVARMIWLLFIILLFLTLAIAVIGKTLTSCFKASPRCVRRSDQCKRAEVVTSLLVTSSSGAIVSIMIYFVVNESLIGISLSPFYAFLCGILLMFVGLILFWQTLVNYFGASGTSLSHALTLSCFGLLIIFSGVLCFLLEKDWTHTLSVRTKVPLYALLGVSIAFSIVYSAVDMLQFLFLRCCYKDTGSHYSVVHIRLLSTTAAICGLYYGWVFGMLDSEDVNRASLQLFMQKESFYCYPFAAVLGGLSAFTLHYSSVRSRPQKLEMSYLDNQGDDL